MRHADDLEEERIVDDLHARSWDERGRATKEAVERKCESHGGFYTVTLVQCSRQVASPGRGMGLTV